MNGNRGPAGGLVAMAVIPKAEGRHHHGALREELIGACVSLIESEGIGAVSLRRVARAAGVSPLMI